MTDSLERLTKALSDRYTIEREIGAGGMATVYLARDLKHDRNVAVKVLRPELAAVLGAERFLNEIKVTANLQHPHILALFDSGEVDSFVYYVMPYVEGESLREKLNREKQFSVEESIEITKAVASALDYAHRQNVIHRDIKPENILLHDGQPVVADFGIALAVEAAGGTRLTETGLSLGTPQYMSPEQATADREVDGRSDVYSLACVLYEMLAGDPPHTGSTVQGVIAKVITDPPRPITELRDTVPNHWSMVLSKALAKLPADRFATTSQFVGAFEQPTALQLPEPIVDGVPTNAGSDASRNWKWWVWPALVCFAIAVAAWSFLRPSPPDEISRWTVSVPPDQQLAVSHFDRPLAVSPDGSQIAFVTEHRGVRQLYLRGLNEFQARAIPGTNDASNPFFSPDGRSVAFFGEGQLKRISVAGGMPRSICDAGGVGLGGSWGADDTIVFSQMTEGIQRVSASGGVAEDLLRTPVGYAAWPQYLEGRSEVLFTQGSREGFHIAVVSLESRDVRILESLGEAAGAVYLPSGALVYSQAGVLMAVQFDAEKLEPVGVPAPLLDSVAMSPGGSAAYYAISNTGSFLYVPARASGRMLVRADRAGNVTPLSDDRADFHAPHLSPDGRQVVVTLVDEGSFDLWVYDVERGTRTMLTPGVNAHDALFSHDGTRVTFEMFGVETENGDLARLPADGAGEVEFLLRQEHQQAPHSWSPDGEALAFYELHPERGRDIWVLLR